MYKRQEYTNGYIEGQNRKGLQPASLYEAQRVARGISTGIMPEAGREDIPHIVVETNRVRVKSQKDAWISIYTTHGSMVQMLKSSSGNWMESMPSVSYTHLDVYKRQVPRLHVHLQRWRRYS